MHVLFDRRNQIPTLEPRVVFLIFLYSVSFLPCLKFKFDILFLLLFLPETLDIHNPHTGIFLGHMRHVLITTPP